jgi:thiol:disulfide interchange protein DsbA
MKLRALPSPVAGHARRVQRADAARRRHHRATASTAAMPASADEPAGTTARRPAPPPPRPNAAADAAAHKALAAANPNGLVEGRDYVEIKDAQPWMPLNGKIEVVEVFGYVCPACAAFNPLVEAWKAKLPADVRFSYVPAPFGPEWNPVREGLLRRRLDGPGGSLA